MRVYNLGIIGYGGFGKFLHTHWSALDRVRVSAIADQSAVALQHLSGVKTFTDWRDLLLEKEIDLIAIVTEPGAHEEMANACMLAGKHVLIEKPLATTLSAARKIMATRDQTGMVAGIDFMMRFHPMLLAIRDLYDQGVFGKLRRVDVENYAQDEQLPPSHWFWNRERSGGILVEHAVHFIDLIHCIAPSKILTVNGLKHDRNPQQEDQIMANVVYESGLIATHYHSFARPGFFETTQIKMAFDLADLELFGWIPLRASVKALVNGSSKQTLLAESLFSIGNTIPIDLATDESRPAGWGISEHAGNSGRQSVRSGGVSYQVDEIITGELQARKTKQDMYAYCVQASLLDVLQKIDHPSHKLAAPLESGLDSLEVAVRASDSARNTPDI